jgi:hypothetical protein
MFGQIALILVCIICVGLFLRSMDMKQYGESTLISVDTVPDTWKVRDIPQNYTVTIMPSQNGLLTEVYNSVHVPRLVNSSFVQKFDWVLDNIGLHVRVQVPRTIFIKTDLVVVFERAVLPLLNESNSVVLYFGDADLSLGLAYGREKTLALLRDPRVTAIASEEKDIKDRSIIAMPIGFNPSHVISLHAYHHLEGFYRPMKNREHLLLAGCMTMRATIYGHRNDRLVAKSALQSAGLPWLDNDNPICSDHTNYYRRLSNTRFVISPFGNTYDCFRTWESLWFGAIPILLKGPYAEAYLHANISVVVVDSFDEVSVKSLLMWGQKYTASVSRDMLTGDFWWNHMINESQIMEQNR